ncbi:Uma2 family endonuclease [Anabaena lutea]|uniref:Uma2 family endonuclease n=1 Tax=Anabaena lutea FACHB-196 TaxID=2692881 RepID=A0ABR8F9S8_9NOST|nr:Uma2 family endonuclease [Anabaena lutea]MBD2566967.1 Uma2 family endonuclease [Anabaena lutea FACHB-196]
MTLIQDIPVPEEDVIFPPGDLYSDEPPLETDLHRLQMTLLIQCLEWLWQNNNKFYASGNVTVYYSPRQLKSEHFRGPDFFVVLGTERKPRKSWVVWEEDGKYPNVIVELLSDSTAKTDKGLKKQIYQDIFRTPEYFWFDPQNLEFVGFVLLAGKYQPIEPNSQGWLWSQQLELFLGVDQNKLRFFTAEGELVPTPEEVAKHEFARAEQEKQRAEEERQCSDRLAAKLRELGIDPNTV